MIGARRLVLFNRDAAVIGTRIGADEVTYLVQRARGVAPEHAQREEGDAARDRVAHRSVHVHRGRPRRDRDHLARRVSVATPA